MKHILLLLMLALTAGCATTAPVHKPLPEPPPRVVVTTPEPTHPGSLWVDGGADLISDIKARRPGDILTVAIYERASASKEASTSTGRSTNLSAGVSNFLGLEDKIVSSGMTPSSLVKSSLSSDFEGSGSTSRKEDLIATLTTRVIEVLPNGNLRIKGSKAVAVNNETQYITLSGIVRQTDVSSRNQVDSKYILDSRISYTGKGVISAKQRPGWLTQLLDYVTPF